MCTLSPFYYTLPFSIAFLLRLCNHNSMGKQKKLKMLRHALKEQAKKALDKPDVSFETIKPHYKRMKKIIFGKGGTLA